MKSITKNVVHYVLRTIGIRGVLILDVVDWNPLREALEALKKKRGRPSGDGG